MPGGDRTGPRGEGPATGGGWGTCTGQGIPGHPGTGWRPLGRGRGWGRFRGGGPGWRHRLQPRGAGAGWWGPAAGPEPSGDLERRVLEARAASLEQEVEEVRRRLAELEAQSRPSEEGS
jgi:hypothetical protein